MNHHSTSEKANNGMLGDQQFMENSSAKESLVSPNPDNNEIFSSVNSDSTMRKSDIHTSSQNSMMVDIQEDMMASNSSNMSESQLVPEQNSVTSVIISKEQFNSTHNISSRKFSYKRRRSDSCCIIVGSRNSQFMELDTNPVRHITAPYSKTNQTTNKRSRKCLPKEFSKLEQDMETKKQCFNINTDMDLFPHTCQSISNNCNSHTPSSSPYKKEIHSSDIINFAIKQDRILAVPDIPPINRFTLGELGIKRILTNPKLRHEIMFETKLEFRPKQLHEIEWCRTKQAEKYWETVEKELKSYMFFKSYFGTLYNPSHFRIARLIVEIKLILLDILEDSNIKEDMYQIQERIDCKLLYSQLKRSMFDPIPYVEFFSQIMMELCKPELKPRIENIIELVNNHKYIEAFKECLLCLEQIKMDIANQGIETYRRYLKATSISYTKTQFKSMIKKKTLKLDIFDEWWQGSYNVYKKNHSSLFNIFLSSFQDLVFDTSMKIPEIMYMDEIRLVNYKCEAYRLVFMSCLFLAFNQFNSRMKETTKEKSSINEDLIKSKSIFINTLSKIAPEFYPTPIINKQLRVPKLKVFFENFRESLEKEGIHVYNEDKLGQLEAFLTNSVLQESKIKQILEKKIKDIFVTLLAGTNNDPMQDLKKVGIDLFAPHIHTILSKMSPVLSYHWSIYGEFYTSRILEYSNTKKE
ncbi:hypothetical protein BB559_006021 [Furculomyces boomerangus]|uniref:Uncharacterized protein n=1 Tax=Furculomyces boomerangus TaxID=61424 RepID=A0A2T9Y5D3_9FUNG|nr:hypothetical protein BB559_006661 [Furculomyces boomerangus]PVU87525.1 hypothetical protein BB559_006021 [Furculomyces boomerangus]